MQGFAEYALILFSDDKHYSDYSEAWKNQYRVAAHNLITLLHMKGIEPRVLITDQVADMVLTEQVTWLATETAANMFFMYTYYGVPRYTTIPLPEDIQLTLDAKWAIKVGTTPQDRHVLVDKRVRYAEKELTKRAQLIFSFSGGYNPYPKEGDGRCIVNIKIQDFTPTVALGKMAIPPTDFMQYPYASQSLINWRFD